MTLPQDVVALLPAHYSGIESAVFPPTAHQYFKLFSYVQRVDIARILGARVRDDEASITKTYDHGTLAAACEWAAWANGCSRE